MAQVSYADKTRQVITGRHLLIVGLALLSLVAGILVNLVEPLYVILGVAGLIVLFLIMKYDYLGLIIYLLIFLFRPGETYTGLEKIRLELILGSSLAFLTLLKNKHRYGSFTVPDSKLNTDFLLLLVAIAASLVFSFCKDCTIESLQNMIKLGVFYLLIILVVDTPKRLEIFFWIFILTVGKSAFDITFGFYHGQAIFNQGLSRATGANSSMDNFNGIAITMNTVIPFVYYFLLHYKGLWKKAILGLILALFVWTLIITGSRGGLIGFLAITGVVWWQSRHKLAMALFLIVFLIVGWTFLGEDSKARYLTIFGDQLDESSENRIKSWMDGIMLFIKRPISGVGAGAFATARSESFGVYLNAHSLYIQVLAELGLVGTIIYIKFLRDLFRTNLRTIREVHLKKSKNFILEPISRATIVSCFSLLITGIFAHSAYRYTWYFLAALTVVGEHLLKRESSETMEIDSAARKISLPQDGGLDTIT